MENDSSAYILTVYITYDTKYTSDRSHITTIELGLFTQGQMNQITTKGFLVWS